ncbi:MAG: hypothetical protein JXR29_05460 [Methylothermaceae bacterium]|nr:hypothetical protein [Methylothermaceae bacterium]
MRVSLKWAFGLRRLVWRAFATGMVAIEPPRIGLRRPGRQAAEAHSAPERPVYKQARRLTAICVGLILAAAAGADESLLNVGKTPADILNDKVAQTKDKVNKALLQLERKQKALQKALTGFNSTAENSIPNPALPDPTQPDPAFQRSFRALLRQGQKTDDDTTVPVTLPAVTLVAKVLKPHMPPAAMLQVGAKTVLVKDGDEVTVFHQDRLLTLRIEAITDNAVRLLVLPQNEPLVLH